MENIRMDLRLFDANTQVTTQQSLTEEMKTFYSDYLIDAAEPELVHDQFAQKHPIPANGGKTIQFRRFAPLGKAAALTGGQASTAAVAASQQAGGYYRAMLAGKLPELAQLAYERYSSEHKTRLSAIDRMLDAADSRDGVTKAQIAALLDMDDAAYDRADSKLQQQAKALADAKAAADKKAKAAQTAAEKEKAARDKAQTAARSDARRQIALILRNGGTVPDDLWQQSGYSAVTIAAMLRGRKG